MTADDRAGDAAREQIQTLIAKLRDAHEDLQSDEYNTIGRLNTLAWIGERTPLILAAFGFLLAALDAAEGTITNKEAALAAYRVENEQLREALGIIARGWQWTGEYLDADALSVLARAALGGEKL